MKKFELDALVEHHLNLQVEISYPEHRAFLLRHGLEKCADVLDVGTGNGAFISRLAKDHPGISFFGIDKRRPCIDACQRSIRENLGFSRVDMFGRQDDFDLGRFDGILMRYFLLHVDNSRKILELLQSKCKRPSRLWVIDLDWSEFSCTPRSDVFDRITKLVQDFCAHVSVDSHGANKIESLLRALDFQNIVVERAPLSYRSVSRDKLAQYLKQEVLCYSLMRGLTVDEEILSFLEHDFKAGKCDISYGMTLVSAELG